MRTPLLPVMGLVALLATLLVTDAPLAAEDPPAPAPVPAPAPAPAPTPSAEPEAPKSPPSPREAWERLTKEANNPATRKPNGLQEGAKAYLETWTAAKLEPKGEDFYFLGQLYQALRRFDEAVAMFEQSASCLEVEEGQRLSSVVLWTSLMRMREREGKLSKEQALAALKALDGWLPLAKGTSRGTLLWGKAQLLGAAGSVDEALTTLADAGEANPELSSGLADAAVDLLIKPCEDLTQLEPCRAKLAPVLARLAASQQQALVNARKALEALAPDSKDRQQAEQRVKRAEGGVTSVATSDTPLKLLGATAPEWTLVKAYGQGKALSDYRGKVVVLDFWATWCPWCIKSFPALRDLLKDYAGKDLVVVGVTASAGSVYEQRYDLDDDLKAKASPGPVKPALQRARPPASLKEGADEETQAKHAAAQAEYEKSVKEFPAREMELIATFIANHAMTWDVVQIDPQEPGPKYALGGWPHCVVIDREGRVRHFKSGALLREKPEAVAKFRAVIDALLAEPAAPAR